MPKVQGKQIENLYLNDLTNVNTTGLTNNNVILYNSGTTSWESAETIDIDSVAQTSSVIPTKYSITTGFTSDNTTTITHGLGTDEIIVQVWDSLDLLTGVSIELNSGDTTNKIDVTTSTSGTYKVVVIG